MKPRKPHNDPAALSATARPSTPPGVLLAAATALSLPAHFHTKDEAAAYAHFLPLARRVDVTGLPHFRNDPDLAVHNIAIGLDNIRPFLDELPTRCPTVSVAELLELPAIALGLCYAAHVVPGRVASQGEIQRRAAAIKDLRVDASAYLAIAARRGLVPTPTVDAIGRKRGAIATARDGMLIASVFRDHAEALRSKHPFSDEELATLATESAWLRAALKPANARPAPAAPSPESVVRDRFARLLDERYDKLRTVGVVLFGIRNVDAKVPPLYSASRVTEATDDEGGEEPKDGEDDGGDEG